MRSAQRATVQQASSPSQRASLASPHARMVGSSLQGSVCREGCVCECVHWAVGN